jgi:hypothetical protein
MFAYFFKILQAVLRNSAFLQKITAEQLAQRAILQRILDSVTPPPNAARVVFTARINGQSFPGVESMIIKATQEFDASVAFQDSLGNPAPVEGVPAWTNSNESVLSMVVAADGLSAVVSAVGVPGSGQISVQADADLGEGVTTITGTLDIEVTPGDAINVVLNTGAVRERTPEPTPEPTT